MNKQLLKTFGFGFIILAVITTVSAIIISLLYIKLEAGNSFAVAGGAAACLSGVTASCIYVSNHTERQYFSLIFGGLVLIVFTLIAIASGESEFRSSFAVPVSIVIGTALPFFLMSSGSKPKNKQAKRILKSIGR